MTSKVTVDASVVLSWVLPDETAAATLDLRRRAVEQRELRLLVPSLFWVELANVLWVSVRRGRLSQPMAHEAFTAIRSFGFQTDMPDVAKAFDLAFRCDIAVYDALYLQLCFERGTTLWTTDRALSEAAAALKISVEPHR